MIKKMLPRYAVTDVKKLDRSFYEENGIKAVIFDIDNTLVKHTQAVPTKEIHEYLENLKLWGIKFGVVSNNSKERVENFCRELGIRGYYRAFKPRKKYLKKAIEAFGCSESEICFVGDQIFTDIYGANRMKFVPVLVSAVGEDETGFVSFKRRFEKKILKKYAPNLTYL